MKIRTRLLLFLLPILIGGITLISLLLAYNWHGAIIDSFTTRLRAAVVSTATLVSHEKLKNPRVATPHELAFIRNELEISNLHIIPIDSPTMATLPKEVHITPIYQGSQGKVMTGYAPIYDAHGNLLGLMAADVSVGQIDKKFQETLLLILCSASCTILVVVATLYFIANKISRPVQKLNNSALAIAAGHYGGSIQAEGPKEIAELANTLNTMSECLHENINRLKENSLFRERSYGEYECSMLLQHLMLQKNIDDCRSDAIAIKSITFFSENPRGLLLDFPKAQAPQHFLIHMEEAEEEGFEGMYQLLTRYKHFTESSTHTSLLLNTDASTLQWNGAQIPLIWSLEDSKFYEATTAAISIQSGDFFFLFNRGFVKLMRTPQRTADLLCKVLKIFSRDGLETVAAMIHKEIGFAIKRRDLDDDIHILCFQVLIPNVIQ
ncbi:MAG: HAMP domain-containing protein [Chlamydiia bacterium]|nr:HAMP domain-containing protein [Chlamydiia bacterium]